MWDYLSHIGGYQISFLFFSFGLDKIFHITTIFLSGILLFILLSKVIKHSKVVIYITTIILFIISVGKELFDLYIRATMFSYNDLFADFIGLILFYILCIYLIYRTQD